MLQDTLILFIRFDFLYRLLPVSFHIKYFKTNRWKSVYKKLIKILDDGHYPPSQQLTMKK